MLKQMPDSDRIMELLIVVMLILTGLMLLCYTAIFINPQVLMNPFPPPIEGGVPVANAAEPTSTVDFGPPTYPPTWTPTATSTPTPTGTVTDPSPHPYAQPHQHAPPAAASHEHPHPAAAHALPL
jgi:hypothetical protein